MNEAHNFFNKITRCNGTDCDIKQNCMRYKNDTDICLKHGLICDRFINQVVDDSLNQLRNMFGMQ